MKILILDDDFSRHKEFNKRLIGCSVTNVETSKEAIQKLEEEIFDIVFLDHDLGGMVFMQSGENTGFEVAKWLSENEAKQPRRIIIHSFNPVGAKNMKSLLPSSEVIPGAWSLIKIEESPSMAKSAPENTSEARFTAGNT